jgi:hypothetical protein
MFDIWRELLFDMKDTYQSDTFEAMHNASLLSYRCDSYLSSRVPFSTICLIPFLFSIL